LHGGGHNQFFSRNPENRTAKRTHQRKGHVQSWFGGSKKEEGSKWADSFELREKLQGFLRGERPRKQEGGEPQEKRGGSQWGIRVEKRFQYEKNVVFKDRGGPGKLIVEEGKSGQERL